MKTAITPIHTQIRGRARFRIQAPARTPRLCARVEAQVRRLPGVKRVQIRPLTGSLLVIFDTREDWRSIRARIAACITVEAPDGGLDAAKADRRRRGTPPPPAGTTPSETRPRWHQLEAHRILALTRTSLEQGLEPEQAAERSRRRGLNIAQTPLLRGRLATLKEQFMLFPLTLLLAEAAAALLGGALLEAAFLALAMGFNVMAGYAIDRRAERAIAAFEHRPQPPAQVLRSGVWSEREGEALVVGDILKLRPGTYVGADARILEAVHLKIDESLLTGESQPVDKRADVIHDRDTPLFDRHNMAFMGTLVVGGEGLAVVVATGPTTVYGRLNALFSETLPPQTPVIEKIQALSGALLRVALVFSGGVMLSGLLRGNGGLAACGRALAVAAAGMPAGLPSAATVNLALGFKRLGQENVSIRRLYSLESLSAVRVICFDKTGTLTRSRISVQQIHCAGKIIRVEQRTLRAEGKPFAALEDPDFIRLLEACVLCSESRIQWAAETGRRRISGSPTEVALLHLTVMAGFDPADSYRKHPLQKVRHRSDIRRYMLSMHAGAGGRKMVLLKGDPAEVLEICTRQLRGGRGVVLTEAARQEIEYQNQQMAGAALRVLGFAFSRPRSFPDDRTPFGDLTWIGLVGMAEPIREGVATLMTQLHQAGIRTVMITGDQSATAEAVARRIGLGGGPNLRIFDSARFDALSPEQAVALIRDVHVFSRFNPAQKLEIIKAYQKQGWVVAMTGDGINDGPALRAADVGIAMGLSGTHAAREVADMVLGRDNITSVATAIRQGRASYRNLKRALRYVITTHFSDVMLTAAAASFARGMALSRHRPVQLSLLTDLSPGLALLMEPSHPDIARERPRDRDEPLFSRSDLRALLTESAVLTGGGLAAFGYGLVRYGPGARAATLAYGSLAAAKLLHALTCRPWPARQAGADPRPSNPWLNTALTAALTAQTAAILVPGLRRLLRMAPLGPVDLLAAGLTAGATRSINRMLRGRRKNEARTG